MMNAFVTFMAVVMLSLSGGVLVMGPSVMFVLTQINPGFNSESDESYYRKSVKVCHLLPSRVQVPPSEDNVV
jgi:hypothetical protein